MFSRLVAPDSSYSLVCYSLPFSIGNVNFWPEPQCRFRLLIFHSPIQVASEDEPQSLAEAEQLLNQHAAIREEIDGYAEDYKKMRAMGDRVTQDQTDPQYVVSDLSKNRLRY